MALASKECARYGRVDSDSDMCNPRYPIAIMLTVELATTVATAYEHHSEWRWEIDGAWFGTLAGYILGRLMIWLPLMGIASSALAIGWDCVKVFNWLGKDLH